MERILVCDDSEDSRLLMTAVLAKAGYEVETAVDGEDCLGRVPSFRPDLILLDIVMPGMDGYDVCRVLKADPRTQEIPVVFLSALGEARDKIRGLEIGGADYITKPFDRGEVIARVRTQLKIRRLTEELRESNRVLMEKQRRLDEDLEAAAGIQRRLLPHRLPRIEELDLAWRFVPSAVIGGDLLNVFPLDEDHVGFYVFDVSGHGAPAALVAVCLYQDLQPDREDSLLRMRTQRRLAAPGEVLASLEALYPIERFDKYFTLCYGIVEKSTGRLTYSSAGHPPPLLVRRRGSVTVLEAGGPIIGLGRGMPFEEEEIVLERGDRLVCFTDGVTEYGAVGGARFGLTRLENAVARDVSTLTALLDGILEELRLFGDGAPNEDDITLLGLEYRGGAA
ncbi:MAG TPA: SpoIIE family protein phosphatase [Syntrophales bacterium]|nr:SpoIIE family protein phosphatase [Syntrophales bacterium]HPC00284.1 SpoIIE family protein phosphatase [Syntrophales bacterium]HRV41822.1 SpoIIE family protein phosphatase [Syntrophales bacterium]